MPYLSIAENIFLGNERTRPRRAHRLEPGQRRGRRGCSPRSACDENPVTPVGQLGVGKQQLVEIAKALSKDVRLLILDEPTAALNDNDSAHLLDLLRRLRDRGITSIMISHKLNEIVSIADRTTVIRDGRTVETMDMSEPDATPGADHPRHGRPRPGQLLPRPGRPHPARRCCGSRTGRSGTPPRTARSSTAPSLTVRAGEVVGIAGLMGAGRTELAMSIFGRSYGRDISGRVFVHGKEVRAAHRRRGDRQRHRLRHRGPQELRPQPHRGHPAQRLGRRRWASCPARGWVNGNEEIKVAEESRRDAEHQGAERDERGRQALRRQPAEGRAVASGCSPTRRC